MVTWAGLSIHGPHVTNNTPLQDMAGVPIQSTVGSYPAAGVTVFSCLHVGLLSTESATKKTNCWNLIPTPEAWPTSPEETDLDTLSSVSIFYGTSPELSDLAPDLMESYMWLLTVFFTKCNTCWENNNKNISLSVLWVMWLLSLFNYLNEDLPAGIRKHAIVNNGFSHVRQASMGISKALTSG